MDDQKLVEMVQGITDWWDYLSVEKFVGYAKRLISLGMSAEEAIDFLSGCYNTVSHEYGN